ncbi:MAG: RnfABCDGE type electron transport complex subunit D [Clostridia bacterium]|nr:RnfABCDGE type electron transport complex subunit D [Clostridia bacterium]
MNKNTIGDRPIASVSRKFGEIDILIALAPVVAWACICFSMRALLLVALSALVCLLLDLLFSFLIEKRISRDLVHSAATGIIISLTTSHTAPLWVPTVACAVAMTTAKYQFAFWGKRGNIFSPAALGILLCALLPGNNSYFVDCFRSGAMPSEGLFHTIIGNTEGAMGTVCTLILVISAVYLMLRGTLSFKCFLAGSVALAALSIMIYPEWTTYMDNIAYQFAAGGTLFYMIFVAFDQRCLPFTGLGKLIYGALFAALMYLFRCYTALPAPEAIAALSVNLLAPIIDYLTRPAPFGGRIRKAKKQDLT